MINLNVYAMNYNITYIDTLHIYVRKRHKVIIVLTI